MKVIDPTNVFVPKTSGVKLELGKRYRLANGSTTICEQKFHYSGLFLVGGLFYTSDGFRAYNRGDADRRVIAEVK